MTSEKLLELIGTVNNWNLWLSGYDRRWRLYVTEVPHFKDKISHTSDVAVLKPSMRTRSWIV